MASLYEINQDILNCIDFETGEILDYEKLEELQIEKNEKIENIALWIKNLEAETKAIKDEINVLRERNEMKERKIEKLKQYLAGNVEKKFETSKVIISYRKSVSVNITDESQIEEKYIKTKVETSVDKTAIKEDIKNGITVSGAELIEKQNIQIK